MLTILRISKSKEPRLETLLEAARFSALAETKVLLLPFSRRFETEDLYFHTDLEKSKKPITIRCSPEFVNFCNKNTGFYDSSLEI
jgi:hypothetical protein